jgi:hypothetical protein
LPLNRLRISIMPFLHSAYPFCSCWHCVGRVYFSGGRRQSPGELRSTRMQSLFWRQKASAAPVWFVSIFTWNVGRIEWWKAYGCLYMIEACWRCVEFVAAHSSLHVELIVPHVHSRYVGVRAPRRRYLLSPRESALGPCHMSD